MQGGTALEKAGQGGEQEEEDCLHARNATPGDQKKSRESISTKFLVGTGESMSTNSRVKFMLSLVTWLLFRNLQSKYLALALMI